LIPAWIETSKDAEIPTGLGVDKALRRALELRDRLRGTLLAASFRVDTESVETFHALCTLLDQPGSDPKVLLADASAAFEFISPLDWPSGKFGGRADLLSRLAFLCWRFARQAENAVAEAKWRGAHSLIEGSSVVANAKRTLVTMESLRLEFSESDLEGSEQLLSLCTLLWGLGEVEPARARNEAVLLYGFLEKSKCSIGIFDERDYYLGEFALIAGGTCRILSKRKEASRWFDVAEANFGRSRNASAHSARLAYQRLALKLEERDFISVLELAPRWVECFSRLGLAEDALKCRFLEAHVLKETERLEEAKQKFRLIKTDAEALGLDRLAAIAGQNLFQIHVSLNEVEQAIMEAKGAALILAHHNNRVGLAKIHLGVGFLLRGQRRLPESIEAFRESQRQSAKLDMRADVAAVNLILADLFLDAGQPSYAEREIRAALPAIDELKLVPEGIAALSLLRDSLRRRQIDHQALRSLSSYFEKLSS
jgi:hypothetical protein